MTGTDPSLSACIYLAPHWATWSHLPLDGLGMHVIHGCCFLRVMLTHTSEVDRAAVAAVADSGYLCAQAAWSDPPPSQNLQGWCTQR